MLVGGLFCGRGQFEAQSFLNQNTLRACVHVWRCRQVGEHGPGSAFQVVLGHLSWMLLLCSHGFSGVDG